MAVRDKKAEELEAKGFYRRAATRWAEVMSVLASDSDRELAAERRAQCISKSLSSSTKADTLRDTKMRIGKVCKDMGLIKLFQIRR